MKIHAFALVLNNSRIVRSLRFVVREYKQHSFYVQVFAVYWRPCETCVSGFLCMWLPFFESITFRRRRSNRYELRLCSANLVGRMCVRSMCKLFELTSNLSVYFDKAYYSSIKCSPSEIRCVVSTVDAQHLQIIQNCVRVCCVVASSKQRRSLIFHIVYLHFTMRKRCTVYR